MVFVFFTLILIQSEKGRVRRMSRLERRVRRKAHMPGFSGSAEKYAPIVSLN